MDRTIYVYDQEARLTFTPGPVPAKQANTLPHHFSLHQLRPQPPVASSAVEADPSEPSP